MNSLKNYGKSRLCGFRKATENTVFMKGQYLKPFMHQRLCDNEELVNEKKNTYILFEEAAVICPFRPFGRISNLMNR